MVGLAIWLRLTYEGYISLMPRQEILSLDCVILMIGIILFFTAFLGCCGAWCKNRCALLTVKIT